MSKNRDADAHDDVDVDGVDRGDAVDELDADSVGDADGVGADGAAARPTGKSVGTRRGRAALADEGDTLTLDREDDATVAKPVKAKAAKTDGSRNPFAAVWLFLRQVVAELKKVIWPNRSQMVNYTIIVLVFVVVMSAIIAGLDIGFAKLILWAFG